MKNILFVTSESVPFIKTGGLADVVGSLPKYLDKEYFDARVILPKYNCMRQEHKDMMKYVTHFYMNLAGKDRYVGVLEAEYDGVKYYFIDNEEYFGGWTPYGDLKRDCEKFAFFSRAALSALPLIGFKPDIVHCHDWQTGLVPVYMKDSFRGGEFYWDMKSVMTIHNLKFQGNEHIDAIKYFSGLSDYYFTSDKLEAFEDGNMLKGGLTYADAITTVSPTYAEEIKTEEYGEHLEGVLNSRSHDLRGILNGIDYDVFNTDKNDKILWPYDSNNAKDEKYKNKLALQQMLGLPRNPNVFMLGMITRLTPQKGLDLIAHILDELLYFDDIQLVALGTGDSQYEEMLRHFAWKYPNKVSANIYYSDDLSHKIYAATDAFLMPSKFEPCGLSQLMALKYGSIPIVRETGGLRDTVESYNEFEHIGTGFTFYNYNAHELMDTIRKAEKLYYNDKEEWNNMMKRAMEKDFSWQASAKKYQEMYDWLKG